MAFVKKVRYKTDKQHLNIRTAVTEAIDECIKENILSDFFTQHRDEVIDVSIFEYDEEGHMDVIREEGREEGSQLATLKSIKNIMIKLNKSCDEAMDILEVENDKREELKKLLQD